jgi:hypothetical protein
MYVETPPCVVLLTVLFLTFNLFFASQNSRRDSLPLLTTNKYCVFYFC